MTDYGPGYYNYHAPWIRVTRGGRVFFFNGANVPLQYRGDGFDSGIVQPGEVREVAGISALTVGHYTVYDQTDPVGDLYIDPNPVEPIT